MPSIWITSKSRPERSDAIQSLHPRRRQRYEAAGGGRFRQTSPRGPRNVSLRQPNRSGKLARRDVDQHLVHGPLPEPVLRNCRLPTRYRLLLPVKAAKPWPLDFDLAAVEADPALRFPPAVRLPVTTSRMAWTTDCLRIVARRIPRLDDDEPPARQDCGKISPDLGPGRRLAGMSAK